MSLILNYFAKLIIPAKNSSQPVSGRVSYRSVKWNFLRRKSSADLSGTRNFLQIFTKLDAMRSLRNLRRTRMTGSCRYQFDKIFPVS